MKHIGTFALMVLIGAMQAAPAAADPTTCQKKIISQLFKLKKTQVKGWVKCLDKENLGKIPGPCLDLKSDLKLDSVREKVEEAIGAACSMSDLTTLGFPSDCQLHPATTGVEAACAALPVTTAEEAALCLSCWKEAELSAYVATLYASHAEEVCDDALDETSSVCSPLACSTPLPDQRSLGDTAENDCQRGIGKAGFKHLIVVEKTLEKCGLKGFSQADCLADPKVALKLAKSSAKLETLIKKKCGNRGPSASPPFCCRMGQGNACVAAATRQDCEDGGGTVQNNKTCGLDNTCDPVGGGGQKVTWWEICPNSDACAGPTLSTIDDLIGCVDTSVSELTDELLCVQLPGGGWPCGSPSGAFLADY